MTIYYVDAAKGSDANNGTSAGSAFQSIAKMSTIKLKAGDTVLLARGSNFADMLTINGSGTTDKPIVIGAFGEGKDPAFVGKQGIYGTKTANIVIKDLTFSTSYNAIYAAVAENWVIDNVKLLNAGAGTGTGSISMKNSKNVTISNSTFDNVHNDGIYVVNMDGLTIANNVMTNLHGHTADGIQVTDSRNVTVKGNRIDLSTSTDSTKGGVIMNGTSNVVVSGNEVKGGSFGVAVNGWNVAITDNKLSGQTKYSWSAAVLVSQGIDLSNYRISGNQISNANFGVAITGLSRDGNVKRDNIDITGNVFNKIGTATLKIDKAATGSFHDNIVVDSPPTQIKGNGLLGNFAVTGNLNTSAAAINDALAQKAAAAAAQAAALAQAEAAKAQAALKAQADAAAEAAHARAEALAKAEAAAAKAEHAAVSENLNKVQKVGINADKFAVDISGGKVIGNVLDNDINAAGNKLALRAVEGVRVGNNGLDVKGNYGTLHVNLDGSFTYTLAPDALAKLKTVAAPTESFQYKAADGGKVLTSSLSIDVGSYIRAQDPTSASAKAAAAAAAKVGQVVQKPKAVDDFYKLDGDTLSISGNVSTNDVTADGSTMSLRTVGGTTLSGGATDLQGKYGALHIDATGAFTYTLYGDAATKMLGDAKAVESFVYKAALNGSYDQAVLVIDLASHLPLSDTVLM